jgi:hypothetical protein
MADVLQQFFTTLTNLERVLSSSSSKSSDSTVRERLHEVRERTLKLVLKCKQAMKADDSAAFHSSALQQLEVSQPELTLSLTSSFTSAAVETHLDDPAHPEHPLYQHSDEQMHQAMAAVRNRPAHTPKALSLLEQITRHPSASASAVATDESSSASTPTSSSVPAASAHVRRALPSNELLARYPPMFADRRKAILYQLGLTVPKQTPDSQLVVSKWPVLPLWLASSSSSSTSSSSSPAGFVFPSQAPRTTFALNSESDYVYPSQSAGQFDWHLQFSPSTI